MDFLRKNVNQHIGYNGGSSFSASYGGGGGTTIIKDTDVINVKNYGAIGNGNVDDTVVIQNCINMAYEQQKKVYIPAGIYKVTRTLFVYDGIQIQGDGIYCTIIRTPFDKTAEAKDMVNRDKNKRYNTLTNPDDVPALDIATGHNRFYIGNGVVGYYDSDRDTNPNHPLYWRPDGSTEYKKWKSERDSIVSQGRWVGLTGREGYGGAVFKSSQKLGLRYEDYEVKKVRPYGIIHTGIRNVKFSDLQINTNSSDRGKDSAIDFQYKASEIPAAIRDTYDSSVLNIQLYNLYLFSLGKSGYRATRAVDHTIIGCYVRQAAETGFYIDGVTSVFFTGCYCNSCTEGGYILRGCNYCSLNSCAADSCSIGYKLYKCNGVTLCGCGAEATRYEKAAEVDAEDVYKGRAFVIQNSKGVSLLSPYTMTSHPKVYSDEAIDITDEELDENWLKSRHVFVSDSQNVVISYPYFKCFERARRTAFTTADGVKVNCLGGTYNGNDRLSRSWQIQNYLVGAQYEIRGESSSVQIVAAETKESLCKESEIRTGNLDLLDLGTVPNPLGYDTAGRTLTGGDGNGGWTYTDENDVTKHISFENFEFVFPANAKKLYGQRDKFWRWRNSLILVRKFNDASLEKNFPNKCYGYISELGEHIDWSQVTEQQLSRFSIDIIDDYDTTLIDGSKKLYSYGKFSWQQLDSPIAFEPAVYSPIPCYVRDKGEGHRIAINSNSIDGFPTEVNKASVSIIGNKNVAGTETTLPIVAGSTLAVYSRRRESEMTDKRKAKVMFVTNTENKDLFSVYEKNEDKRAISVNNRDLISTKDIDYNYIHKLPYDASIQHIAGIVNTIIDRLINHGLMIKPAEGDLSFINAYCSSFDDTAATLKYTIQTYGDTIVYRTGVAYSSTNQMPQYIHNHSTSNIEGTYYNVSVPYGDTDLRYVRFYAETDEAGGESNRIYSDQTYILAYDRRRGTATFVRFEDYTPSNMIRVNFRNFRILETFEGGVSVIFDVYTNENAVYSYGIGAAYSSVSVNPVYSDNHVNSYQEASYDDITRFVEIPYDGNNRKYLRIYANTSIDGSESNRVYSDTYVIDKDSTDHITLTPLSGFNPDTPIVQEITFSDVSIDDYDSNEATIKFKMVNTTVEDIYKVGAAYSPSNTTPTVSNNNKDATALADDYYTVTITYGSNNTRYIRFYVNTSTESSENSRTYSRTYKMVYNGVAPTIELYNAE